MRSKSDFWLVLHQLAGELEKEGRKNDERVDNLMVLLERLPPEVVTAYVENLEIVAKVVNELLTRAKTR
jgi:hypothetical protein